MSGNLTEKMDEKIAETLPNVKRTRRTFQQSAKQSRWDSKYTSALHYILPPKSPPVHPSSPLPPPPLAPPPAPPPAPLPLPNEPCPRGSRWAELEIVGWFWRWLGAEAMVTLLESDAAGKVAAVDAVVTWKRRCGEERRCCEWKSGWRSSSLVPARFTSVSLPWRFRFEDMLGKLMAAQGRDEGDRGGEEEESYRWTWLKGKTETNTWSISLSWRDTDKIAFFVYSFSRKLCRLINNPSAMSINEHEVMYFNSTAHATT